MAHAGTVVFADTALVQFASGLFNASSYG